MNWLRPGQLAVCLGSGLSAVLMSSSALAASPRLVPSPISGPGGTTVALSGIGFCVTCGVVEIDFATTPVKRGIVVASDGSFQTTFIVPGGAQAGTDAINAYQQGVLVSQATFDVTPSQPAPTGQPPPSPTPHSSPTPKSSPASTPKTATPSTQPSPLSSGPGGPPPASVASGGGLPAGVLIAILLVLVVAGGAIVVGWWQTRRA